MVHERLGMVRSPIWTNERTSTQHRNVAVEHAVRAIVASRGDWRD